MKTHYLWTIWKVAVIIPVLTCLLSVPVNRFMPYWPVWAELLLRLERGKQKASGLSTSISGFRSDASTIKKTYSHMNQSSGTAWANIAGRNVFQGLPLTWQSSIWIKTITFYTRLFIAQTRCHLTALSPNGISTWHLSQDHHFFLPYCLLCVYFSFYFSFLLLCVTASAPLARQLREWVCLTSNQQWRGQYNQTMWPSWQGGCSPCLAWLCWDWKEPPTVFSMVFVLGQVSVENIPAD